MSWKEFLKPDWKKLIITFLLFLFLPFPYYEAHPECMTVVGIKCNPYWTIGFIGIGTIIDVLEGVSIYYILQNYGIYYLSSIIVWYLISCSTIWSYDKFKKR